MKTLTIILLSLFVIQEDVPYKPSEEFDLKFNFEFKDRGVDRNVNKIEMDLTLKEAEKRKASGLLPYLYLNLKVLKQQPEEIRVKLVENNKKVVMNKKFDSSTVLKLDLGFTDDIKDRTGAYEYIVTFLNEDKDPVSRIVIYFETDGTYKVNDQVRGKI